MGTMLRSLLVCVTFLSSWLETSESGGNMLEHYLIRDDSDNLYIVEVEGKNGTSKGVQEKHSYQSLYKSRSDRKKVKKEQQKKKEKKRRKEIKMKQEKKGKTQKKGKKKQSNKSNDYKLGDEHYRDIEKFMAEMFPN